ncbi:hypothetical protein B5807_09441 [Epicoccum nigrum]|uniref:Uncharacterized protein n=1 Tax=Epicoccum nigrum TaxID=105696 RepID=A0A1Y2LRP0_EPING|nr:hypothetical protein B5807_09441 [Epicoccum nigrum]
MEGLPTSQGFQSEEQPPQQVPHGIDPCGNNFPSNRVAFQYRLDRAETPFDAEADATDDQQDNLLVPDTSVLDLSHLIMVPLPRRPTARE